MGGNEPPPKDRPRSAAEYVPDVDYPGAVLPEWVSKLRPGMFIPRGASRLTLYVTEVRVEGLPRRLGCQSVGGGLSVPAGAREY